MITMKDNNSLPLEGKRLVCKTKSYYEDLHIGEGETLIESDFFIGKIENGLFYGGNFDGSVTWNTTKWNELIESWEYVK